MVQFNRLIYVNVKLTTEGFQWDKTEPIWAQGQTGRPRSVAGWAHFAPKNSDFLPKNSL
jgi:hypothetical protein